jgi:hypothetical protein
MRTMPYHGESGEAMICEPPAHSFQVPGIIIGCEGPAPMCISTPAPEQICTWDKDKGKAVSRQVFSVDAPRSTLQCLKDAPRYNYGWTLHITNERGDDIGVIRCENGKLTLLRPEKG